MALPPEQYALLAWSTASAGDALPPLETTPFSPGARTASAGDALPLANGLDEVPWSHILHGVHDCFVGLFATEPKRAEGERDEGGAAKAGGAWIRTMSQLKGAAAQSDGPAGEAALPSRVVIFRKSAAAEWVVGEASLASRVVVFRAARDGLAVASYACDPDLVARDGLAVASYACDPDLSSALGEYAARRMREALRVSAAAAHSVLRRRGNCHPPLLRELESLTIGRFGPSHAWVGGGGPLPDALPASSSGPAARSVGTSLDRVKKEAALEPPGAVSTATTGAPAGSKTPSDGEQGDRPRAMAGAQAGSKATAPASPSGGPGFGGGGAGGGLPMGLRFDLRFAMHPDSGVNLIPPTT
ncbi:hypothetical protein T484DRAFT_1774634 [Baffinella frigidus]|nr:hypothetical protein T484DRAFT_1774634 [Cryptophyta sp. CCMP2293]